MARNTKKRGLFVCVCISDVDHLRKTSYYQRLGLSAYDDYSYSLFIFRQYKNVKTFNLFRDSIDVKKSVYILGETLQEGDLRRVLSAQ